MLFRQLLQQISYAGKLNQFSTKAQGISSHCTVPPFCERILTNMTAPVKVRCCTTLTPQLVKLLFVATPESDTARSHWLGERGLCCTEARKGFYWFSSTTPCSDYAFGELKGLCGTFCSLLAIVIFNLSLHTTYCTFCLSSHKTEFEK